MHELILSDDASWPSAVVTLRGETAYDEKLSRLLTTHSRRHKFGLHVIRKLFKAAFIPKQTFWWAFGWCISVCLYNSHKHIKYRSTQHLNRKLNECNMIKCVVWQAFIRPSLALCLFRLLVENIDVQSRNVCINTECVLSKNKNFFYSKTFSFKCAQMKQQ